jgi:hypothetical protein
VPAREALEHGGAERRRRRDGEAQGYDEASGPRTG